MDGTPPGLIGYEEHQAGSKGLHMNFAFVADVPSRELAACDEWSEARWVTDTDGIDCPENVRQLVRIALRGARLPGLSGTRPWRRGQEPVDEPAGLVRREHDAPAAHHDLDQPGPAGREEPERALPVVPAVVAEETTVAEDPQRAGEPAEGQDGDLLDPGERKGGRAPGATQDAELPALDLERLRGEGPGRQREERRRQRRPAGLQGGALRTAQRQARDQEPGEDRDSDQSETKTPLSAFTLPDRLIGYWRISRAPRASGRGTFRGWGGDARGWREG